MLTVDQGEVIFRGVETDLFLSMNSRQSCIIVSNILQQKIDVSKKSIFKGFRKGLVIFSKKNFLNINYNPYLRQLKK